MQCQPFCEWPLLVCTSTKREEGGSNIGLRILAPLPLPHSVLFCYNNIVNILYIIRDLGAMYY